MPARCFNVRNSALAGAVLTEVPKRVFPKFSEPRLYERLPPIILTSEELRSIRITQDPGLFTKALQSFICTAQHSLSFMSLWNLPSVFQLS